ncbi:MAG: hypothetical protein RIR70_479 [Pseudomonadota bacterium]|jgi:uncharacterized protein (PEP-CTERM system associated)
MARRFEGALFALLAVVSSSALAEVSRVTPSVSFDLAYTDNATLSRAKESDLIFSVRPRLEVEHRGARLNGRVDYAIDGLALGDSNTRSVNSLNAFGALEAIENFLFIDARARISGENFSVFAPIAVDNLTRSNNRSEVRSYGLSPNLRGRFAATGSYDLRLDWSTLDADREGFGKSSNTRLTGSVQNAIGMSRFFWGLTASASVNNYPDRDDLRNDILRARLTWQPRSDASVYGTLGREHYNYVEGESSRRVQGGGFALGLGPRTQISGERESRFFGHSTALRFAHRWPRVATSIDYSRDLSSSNQQVFSAGQGNLLATLFDLYASRIPDPIERLTTVLDFMARTGLPLFLTRPFAFYTQQPFTDRRLQGVIAWTGARNTVGLSAYRSTRAALATGFPLIDDFSFGRHIQTRGGALDWRHSLSPLATLNLTLGVSRAMALDGTANTRNRSAVAGLQFPLTTKSNAFVSLRHSVGDGTTDYRENAAVAGLRLSF